MSLARSGTPLRFRAAVLGPLRLVAAVYLGTAGCLAVLAVGSALALGARPVVVGASTSPGVAAGDVVLLTPSRGPLRRGTLVASGAALAAWARPAPAGEDAAGRDAAGKDAAGEGRLVVPLLGRPLVWLRTRALATLALWCLGTAGAAAVVLRPGRAPDAAPDRPTPREPRATVPRATVPRATVPQARHAAHDVLPDRARPVPRSGRA